MVKLLDKYEDWSAKTLNYSFNKVFVLVAIFYISSTLFDFYLTHMMHNLNTDGFFKHEISFLIRGAFAGNILFCLYLSIIFFLPLAVAFAFNIYSKKHYGYSANGLKIVLYSICFISLLHIFGGLTNFFYLINL